MKKFFLILTTIILASCNFDDENNEELYQSYGVIKEDANTNGKLYVRSDDGKVIIPSISNLLLNDDRDSRVWMLFSTSDNVKSDTIKANVYQFLIVTQMDVKTQNDKSVVSDDVYLREMWIAQDYLTLTMDATASSENSLKYHTYTMYFDEETVSDTVYMEFKYDRNNDATTSKFTKIVALKLDNKINVDSDSVVLSIKYKTTTGLKEQFVTYKK
jgi:hypothetical protein